MSARPLAFRCAVTSLEDQSTVETVIETDGWGQTGATSTGRQAEVRGAKVVRPATKRTVRPKFSWYSAASAICGDAVHQKLIAFARQCRPESAESFAVGHRSTCLYASE